MSLLFAKNNSLSAITELPASVSGGGLNLISTQTASSSATIDFTSGIDSTYKEYIFKFYNMHPATNDAEFQFNLSSDSGSNYNVTKTSTFFTAYHNEDGSDSNFLYISSYDLHPASDVVNFTFNMSIDSGSNYNVTKTTTFFDAIHSESGSDSSVNYSSSRDLAQSTDFQMLARQIGNDNDQSTSGTLHLFEPSSTTFVKHFISNFNSYYSENYSMNHYVAGYGNTSSSVDAVQFKMSSGNIDSGIIKLFGVT